MVDRAASLALPLSTLVERGEPLLVGKLLDLATVLEVRDDSETVPRKHHRVIYHADASLVTDFSEKQVAKLARIVDAYPDLEMVSFHVASCYDEPKLSNGRFVPAGRRLGRAEMLETALRNVSRIAKQLPASAAISIENNNYFATGAYEDVCDPDFLSELVHKTGGLGFVLDWSHARISAAHMGVPLDEYLGRLPLDQAVQLHLSAPRETGSGWLDAHDLPVMTEVAECARLTGRARGMRYLTPEYYRDAAALLRFCESLLASALWSTEER